jgi:hypothetical protein
MFISDTKEHHFQPDFQMSLISKLLSFKAKFKTQDVRQSCARFSQFTTHPCLATDIGVHYVQRLHNTGQCAFVSRIFWIFFPLFKPLIIYYIIARNTHRYTIKCHFCEKLNKIVKVMQRPPFMKFYLFNLQYNAFVSPCLFFKYIVSCYLFN